MGRRPLCPGVAAAGRGKGCWGESWGQTGSGDRAGGPGPSGGVHGPVSPGVKRTPRPQNLGAAVGRPAPADWGSRGRKEELALTPAPVLCLCPHLPWRNRRGAVRTAGLKTNPPYSLAWPQTLGKPCSLKLSFPICEREIMPHRMVLRSKCDHAGGQVFEPSNCHPDRTNYDRGSSSPRATSPFYSASQWL